MKNKDSVFYHPKMPILERFNRTARDEWLNMLNR